MASSLNPFAAAAQQAVSLSLGMSSDLFVVGTPPNRALGDLAVGCFPAAKELKASPAALAQKVADSFTSNDFLLSAQAAGPFVNFKLKRKALFEYLCKTSLEDGDLIPVKPGKGKTICIDYSSPNISKQLAYHHIRSTVIGHSLVNLYRAIGYTVVGINHLGDWGTTHGMLLAAYHKWTPNEELTIAILNQLYVRFRAAMKDDPELEQEGRSWFARLENGDLKAKELWEKFKEVSWKEFESAYDMLGINFEEVKGESEYVDAMPATLALLNEKGLSSISDGALVVMLEEHNMPPLLLRKRDGATLYGTRDLAAAQYRWDSYSFERSLYVVGRGQGLHFKQLFKTLDLAGFKWASKCHHVPFGLVRVGGKKTSTRTGTGVLLKEVFKEATMRAAKKIAENNPEWNDEKTQETAAVVGIGAVVFANLMSQRDKDVDFDWEDILSTSGDSGAYVQYAHARCCRTINKSGQTDHLHSNLDLLTNDAEWALGLSIANFPDVVARAADSNDPHLLSRYLLDLVSTFSTWYTGGNQDKALRVLCQDDETQKARITLMAITRNTVKEGLSLLGVNSPNAM